MECCCAPNCHRNYVGRGLRSVLFLFLAIKYSGAQWHEAANHHDVDLESLKNPQGNTGFNVFM